MIPKVIHYCWFGGKPLPSDTKKYIDSWKKYCPDYEIKEWNENNFDVYSHPFMKAAYEAKAWAFVSDYARLKIIYENGGIYLDTDVELIKNTDFLLKYNFFICITQLDHHCTTGLGFGAEKSSDIVSKMMKKYDGLAFDPQNKRFFACPALNDEVIRNLGYENSNEVVVLKGNVCILPSKYMDPLSPGNTQNLLCDDTISIHHYAASWENNRLKLKRKILNILGQDKVNRIKSFLFNTGEIENED